MMHNKLLLDNDLHKKDGLAQASVDKDTVLTNGNKHDMARALTKKVKQWTDGFDKLVGAKQRRDAGDDFWFIVS